MPKLYNKRPVSYSIGCFFVLASFTLFVISYTTSSWLRSKKYPEETWGLWKFCDYIYHKCDERFDVIFALQFISSFCGLGYIISIGIWLFENYRQVSNTYHSRKLEWCTLITAFIGTIVNLVFVVYFVSLWKVRFEWSYYFNCASVLLLYASGCFIAFGNKIHTTNQSMNSRHQQQEPMIYFAQSDASIIPGQTVTANLATEEVFIENRRSNSEYNQTTQDSTAPPPSYASCVNRATSPGSPPPPYVLPPAYPGGTQAAPPPPSYNIQGHQRSGGNTQMETNTPLLPGS